MSNNLQPVNVVYESSNTNGPEQIQRRRASLVRTNAKRNVTHNSKAVRRFSLANKGNVKHANANANVARKRASIQAASKNALRFIKSRRNRK